MKPMALAAALVLLSWGAASAEAEDVESVAAEAGVSVTDLAGAVATTGLPARTYLEVVGELEAPPPPMGVWDRLAMCESGGNWAVNTGNNYYGGLQFDLQTWRAYGGSGMPHQASRATQIAVAERLRAARGYQPWPVCSKRVGLR